MCRSDFCLGILRGASQKWWCGNRRSNTTRQLSLGLSLPFSGRFASGCSLCNLQLSESNELNDCMSCTWVLLGLTATAAHRGAARAESGVLQKQWPMLGWLGCAGGVAPAAALWLWERCAGRVRLLGAVGVQRGLNGTCSCALLDFSGDFSRAFVCLCVQLNEL